MWKCVSTCVSFRRFPHYAVLSCRRRTLAISALLLPDRSSLPAFLICCSLRPRRASFPARLCVLLNSQFPRGSECARQHILACRCQANMRVSHFSPAARNGQENLGGLLNKRRLLL